MPLKNLIVTLALLSAPSAMASEMPMSTQSAPTNVQTLETPAPASSSTDTATKPTQAAPDDATMNQPSGEVATTTAVVTEAQPSTPEVPVEVATTSPLDLRVSELETQLARETTARTELAAQHASALADLEAKHAAAIAALEAKHVDATKQLRDDLRESRFERVLDKVEVRDEHRKDTKALLADLEDPSTDAARARIDAFLGERPLWKKPVREEVKMPKDGGDVGTKLGTFAGKNGEGLGTIRVRIG